MSDTLFGVVFGLAAGLMPGPLLAVTAISPANAAPTTELIAAISSSA